MQIFDYINNILFQKNPYKAHNVEEIKIYNNFLVNRWVSMFDGDSANIVNESTNKKNYLRDDKEMQYKMLLNIIPKNKYKRIDYIKKPTKEE
jgi:adenylate kinase family enzyme